MIHPLTINQVPSGLTRHKASGGFTLVEITVASGIALGAIAVVLSVFIWCMQQSTLCSKIAWSQGEAMKSSDKLLGYLRNAQSIYAIDSSHGNWVDVEFPGSIRVRLIYTNTVTELRDGRMYLVRTNTTETLIARGLTAIMNNQGYPLPVFTTNRADSLHISYRVAEPTGSGVTAADDGDYAACIQFTVSFRNAVD